MSSMQHRLMLTVVAASLGAGLMATTATAHNGPGEGLARSQGARGVQVAQCTNNLCGARPSSLSSGEDKSYGTGVYSGARRTGNAPLGGGNNAIIIVNSKGGAGGSPGMMLGPNTKRR